MTSTISNVATGGRDIAATMSTITGLSKVSNASDWIQKLQCDWFLRIHLYGNAVIACNQILG